MTVKDVFENMDDSEMVELWVEVCGVTFDRQDMVKMFKWHPGILDKDVVRVNYEVYPPRIITR